MGWGGGGVTRGRGPVHEDLTSQATLPGLRPTGGVRPTHAPLPAGWRLGTRSQACRPLGGDEVMGVQAPAEGDTRSQACRPLGGRGHGGAAAAVGHVRLHHQAKGWNRERFSKSQRQRAVSRSASCRRGGASQGRRHLRGGQSTVTPPPRTCISSGGAWPSHERQRHRHGSHDSPRMSRGGWGWGPARKRDL